MTIADPTSAAMRRREDPPLLTGAARYTDDLAGPGALQAAFVRAPLAHGRVLVVEATAAAAMPAVVGVFTAADLALPPMPAGSAPAAFARPVLAAAVHRPGRGRGGGDGPLRQPAAGGRAAGAERGPGRPRPGAGRRDPVRPLPGAVLGARHGGGGARPAGRAGAGGRPRGRRRLRGEDRHLPRAGGRRRPRPAPGPAWRGCAGTWRSTTRAASTTRCSPRARYTAASPKGVAQALYEEVRYDQQGNCLTGTLASYAMPSAADLPAFETTRTQTPTPRNPLGAKGIGESGAVGATPAVQNAVVDALRHLGVTHVDLPLTPERSGAPSARPPHRGCSGAAPPVRRCGW